jgi:hypothetical protein
VTAIVYPTSLPVPSAWVTVARERRAQSQGDGVKSAPRARSRDRIVDVEARWIYTPGEMATWVPWYEDTLLDGTRWCAIPAPGPGGYLPRVCRFRAKSVRRERLAGGNWGISAQLEQRGRTAPPRSIAQPLVWLLGADVMVTPPGVAYGNLWTLDPSDSRIAAIEGSNANTYGGSSIAYGVNDITASRGVASGKRYAEIKPVQTAGSSSHPYITVGLVRSNSAGVITDRSVIWAKTSGDIGFAFIANDLNTICLAVDFDAGHLWIQNGSLNPLNPPDLTGVTGTVTLLISNTANLPDEVYELRTTAAEFAFAIPSGFVEYAA